ncbi:unnamed protein product [Periconia digitata]|uniref:Uncharacterized protein n=1 Tax=Periconia digitata TaxID=1303443 RepID=A0A9W4UJI8_9PLEO|nr:unnamed protein product [Periconia digitata]
MLIITKCDLMLRDMSLYFNGTYEKKNPCHHPMQPFQTTSARYYLHCVHMPRQQQHSHRLQSSSHRDSPQTRTRQTTEPHLQFPANFKSRDPLAHETQQSCLVKFPPSIHPCPQTICTSRTPKDPPSPSRPKKKGKKVKI